MGNEYDYLLETRDTITFFRLYIDFAISWSAVWADIINIAMWNTLNGTDKNFRRLADDISKCIVFNTFSPKHNGRRFADDSFKRILMNENVRMSINISLKFVP